jgi:uncharacterized protein involved in type VI secretion and phage assembly
MTPDTLDDIHAWIRSHFFGKYRGTVTDNNDTTNRGRLKVTVPAVLDTLEIWAMPCVPYAGDSVGFYVMPENGSGVWVEFEGGDPSFPIWSGCYWADNELPADATAPTMKILRSTTGQWQLDDDTGEITIKNDDAASAVFAQDITLDAGGSTQTVGSSGVVSESGGTGKVEVATAGVTVNDGAFKVA